MKKEELIKFKKVEKTPFTLVEIKDIGIIITLGNEKVCNQEFKNFDEAEEFIKNNIWELIIPTICVVAKRINEQEKIYNNQKTK